MLCKLVISDAVTPWKTVVKMGKLRRGFAAVSILKQLMVKVYQLMPS